MRRPLLALLPFALLAAGCAERGVYHRVGPGESAWRIARAYDLSLAELLEANRLPDPRQVRAGQTLWIPGADRVERVPVPKEPDALHGRVRDRQLAWPLSGKVSSGFGGRSGRRHHGIDILAPDGTPVRAAGYGLVLYAGEELRGYGKAVIVDHGEGITTLYGHLRDYRVGPGDAVARGGVIGTVGRTGNATTSHLHFELRAEDLPLDPEAYLVRTAEER